MKKITIFGAFIKMVLPLYVFTSCNYLDVVPPEKPAADDTMKDERATMGFLYTCYKGVEETLPFDYKTYEGSTDEYVNPPLWEETPQQLSWNQFNVTTKVNTWEICYLHIGQCHLFLREIERSKPLGVTEEQKRIWKVEVECMKAYYHFRLLNMFGPIPIINEYPDQNLPAEKLAGRSHYDYVVDYVVDKLDHVAKDLPPTREAEEWGRITSTACKAIKSRLLLYAASDLWNGKFPYPHWQNEKYETPGYGKSLVSTTRDDKKWTRALDASLDALRYAENEGKRKLMQVEDIETLMLMHQVPLPFIPGVSPDTEEGKLFLKKVLLMRYLLNTYETDGNNEMIWGVFDQKNKVQDCQQPLRIIYRGNAWQNGYSGMSPTFHSVTRFYTANGKLPEKDQEFTKEDQWLKSAEIDSRNEIINLNVDREPRFYACFSFDGDDYSSLLAAGKPLRINLRSNQAQGYSPNSFNRDYSVTGYFTKKYIQPNAQYGKSSGANFKNYPRPLFRLAELYLNVAECYAALNNMEALKYLNPIRKRAGIPALVEADITPDMTLMDWVRNERFVELWGEGHRYYDVRRWMIAPKQLKVGAREGLNGKTENPTMEELNQRVVVDQPFQWGNHMYLMPIKDTEVYSDPQLIQAPGY